VLRLSQHLQQRRLARAVAANQAHALPGFQRQIGAIQQGDVTVGQVPIHQGDQ